MSLEAYSVRVDGTSHCFLLAEPGRSASAIVLSLHGTGSTAPEQARLSRMASLADGTGAVVAFPEAVIPRGHGFEWDQELDEPFLLQLIADLVQRFPAAGARVCLTGMSGGARLSCHLAWRRADLVTMVGAVAGLRAGDGPPPSRPVAVVAFHGTADRINPYAGSGTPRWGESVPDAARRWAAGNGLPAAPAEVAVSRTLTRTTYGEPGHPGEVTLWTARGAGHTWPGSPLRGLFVRLLLGRTSMEVDATAELWSFAERHASDP